MRQYRARGSRLTFGTADSRAKDTGLVEWATEIKVRAERRAGEMLRELALPKHRPSEVSRAATLPEMGISRDQSSRWQKLAAFPADKGVLQVACGLSMSS